MGHPGPCCHARAGHPGPCCRAHACHQDPDCRGCAGHQGPGCRARVVARTMVQSVDLRTQSSRRSRMVHRCPPGVPPTGVAPDVGLARPLDARGKLTSVVTVVIRPTLPAQWLDRWWRWNAAALALLPVHILRSHEPLTLVPIPRHRREDAAVDSLRANAALLLLLHRMCCSPALTHLIPLPGASLAPAHAVPCNRVWPAAEWLLALPAPSVVLLIRLPLNKA